MSDETKPELLPAKKDASVVEYVPYGTQDKIKLSVRIVQNLIAVKTKSGATCSERDALRFLAMCQAKRANPFEGDVFLIGYDSKDGPTFSLVTAHQTYLKRAELHPEFDGMKSGIIVREDGALKDLEGDFYVEGEQVVVGGWATVFFKNRKQPMHKRLRLARFQKPFGVWQDDPAGMICKCSEADALRSSFPTMLGGMYLREELEAPTGRMEFAKPIFQSIENGGAAPKPEGWSEAPEHMLAKVAEGQAAEDLGTKGPTVVPDPAQAPENPLPKPDNAGESLLKVIRASCKGAKIKERDLLGFLAEIGISDGSCATLEELALQNRLALDAVTKNWTDIREKLAPRKDDNAP